MYVIIKHWLVSNAHCKQSMQKYETRDVTNASVDSGSNQDRIGLPIFMTFLLKSLDIPISYG